MADGLVPAHRQGQGSCVPGCPHPDQAGRKPGPKSEKDEAEAAGTSWEEEVRT